ncbi:uncharacterized protein LOC111868948 [Cryptotermes secundus]|uniref:uncharacterized protein LOC111868948 n=1 Tax=Cryptotermes secundus TaxID=105785 RepID=UPI000CD7BE78|nr:uncharacterized protein LOC111868948 [Cryptotermes secundus]
MASNLHEVNNCTEGFNDPGQIEMGVTHEQRSECKSHQSTTSSCSEQVFVEDFEYVHSSCYICNGFYGPCFEEPVCATCHAFLFPEDMSHSEAIAIFSEKTDDGDLLLAVFSYLDDVSLWIVGNVCKRWRHLLHTHVAGEQWRNYTMQRWPLFKPLCAVQDWFKIYTELIDSCPCKACLRQMALQSQPPGEENSWRRNRLRNELKSLRTDPPEGIEAAPLDQKCCHWQATITGPVGSPYEGGLFYLYLQIPYSYPMCPPIVRFLTRIFHPNVSRHGHVGIDSIQHNWSLALTISKVLISVQSLLTDPYCQVCMEPAVGALYMKDRSTFEDIARSWTWRYAMHDAISPV